MSLCVVFAVCSVSEHIECTVQRHMLRPSKQCYFCWSSASVNLLLFVRFNVLVIVFFTLAPFLLV